MNYLTLGRTLFALSFIAIAIEGMVLQDFSFGRPPAWPDTTARAVWSFIGGAIVIVAAIAVLLRRKAEYATLAAAATIFISIFLARNVPALLSGDLASAFWSLNAFKTLALTGGACIVALSFTPVEAHSPLQRGIFWFGVVALAYWLFVAGLSHFKYVDFIRGGFIPAYIPFKTFWSYFTGICLLAGGVGMLIPPVRKWAAIMAGFMILGWFFLLHIPRAMAAPADPSEWFGVFESFGFAGICLTLGAIFSEVPTKVGMPAAA